MSRLHIKVFITKTGKFRAEIKEPELDHTYEVTVGGESWYLGKGRKYEKEIKRRCKSLVSDLNSKLSIFK